VLTILFLVAQQVSVGAGATPATPPMLTLAIGVPVVRPDGSAAGVTSASLVEGSTYYLSTAAGLCSAMTVGTVEPKTAGYGWRLTVPQITRAPMALTARLEWQRMWERGRVLTDGPRGESLLTIRREERIPIDQIVTAPDSGGCDASSIAAELWASRGSSGGGGVGGGGAVGAGARAGGRGGAAAPVPPPVNVNLSNGFDLELWLVDRSREGAETVQPLIVHSTDGAPRFFFRPHKIATPVGFALMEVTGQIRALPLGDGSSRLIVSLSRRIEGDATGANTVGGTARMIPTPQPDDVISFDLPAVSGPRGYTTGQIDPLNGHTFSVRLRISAR